MSQLPNQPSVTQLKLLKVLSLLSTISNELFLGDTLADCTEIVAKSITHHFQLRFQIQKIRIL